MKRFILCLLLALIFFLGIDFSGAETPSVDWIPSAIVVEEPKTVDELSHFFREGMPNRPLRIDLAPAQWIWLPSVRALPNQFVLFRREIVLDELPTSATGWMTADSRYRLTVNGRRVGWGPAPCDPRHFDVDPVEITSLLQTGQNVIGVEVLFYGHGDGTWPAGKPGLLFHLQLDFADGRRETIVSDSQWKTFLDRAHKPGQYKRWFLRALQEEFDARLHPENWDTPEFLPDSHWVAAMPLVGGQADKPPGMTLFSPNDLIESLHHAESTSLRVREIPMLKEEMIAPKRCFESGTVDWNRDPNDWFDLRMPDCFTIDRKPIVQEKLSSENQPGWVLPGVTNNREATYLLFEWTDQMVGWPYFEIDAPEGTIIELMCQESHAPEAMPWLDTQFFSWSRFVCKEGINRFEPFDFESLRWLQLHVRNNNRPVTIRNVGIRRRQFDWSHEPVIHCSEPVLQRLFDATINTIYNSAQETVVDGMARERQQYSGDGSHQLHAIRGALGAPGLGRRFLRTFSEGLAPDGYFLDCWPACDRLYRVMEKQIEAAYWGPLLDHGIGFCFDNWNHYMETGDLVATNESYPKLLRFVDYLESIKEKDGLLPVENLGIPTVWIDHNAFQKQRHKQCAFNLYASAMLTKALAPLARARGETSQAELFEERGKQLLEKTIERFWDADRKIFVSNRPWLDEEKAIRTDDRTLAMSIMFDLCPNNEINAAMKSLIDCPPEMGFSYPCNACWRYWGLARAGRADIVLDELRKIWGTMPSVILNNTIAEDWHAPPDSWAQWSHCAVMPVYCLFMDIVGIRPTSPGFATCDIRPQLGDIGDLEIVYHTPQGAIHFTAKKKSTGHEVEVTLPDNCRAMLILPTEETKELRSGTHQFFAKTLTSAH